MVFGVFLVFERASWLGMSVLPAPGQAPFNDRDGTGGRRSEPLSAAPRQGIQLTWSNGANLTIFLGFSGGIPTRRRNSSVRYQFL